VYTGSTTWEHLWHRSTPPEIDANGTFLHSREQFRAACAEEGIPCD
jgi:hypothetical protein